MKFQCEETIICPHSEYCKNAKPHTHISGQPADMSCPEMLKRTRCIEVRHIENKIDLPEGLFKL